MNHRDEVNAGPESAQPAVDERKAGRLWKTIVVWSMAIGFATLIPLGYTVGDGVAVNNACAQSSCCYEIGSICGSLDDHDVSHHYPNGGRSCAST